MKKMEHTAARFSIGEVEKLTGIKQHILRYWEENIPVLNPERDEYGQRVYTQRDLDFVFRLKFLINQRRFTVDGAGAELVREIQTETTTNATMTISKMRNELLQMYALITKYSDKFENISDEKNEKT